MRATLAASALLLSTTGACAADFDFQGYADFRAVAATEVRSYLDGGTGLLRFEDDNSSTSLHFAEAVGQGHVQIAPDFSAIAVARIEPEQRTLFDVLEAYVRYRPVSTDAWRWSIKAGAFFPPVSLENTEIGWTSYWTLTPSAINSWVGDELRTIGGEGTVEWRGESGTLTLMAAGFGWNDPAGVLMADRGWTLNDRPTGLIDHPREPDMTVILFGDTPPDRTPMFDEIDNRAGWYGGASWDDNSLGHFEITRYDNEANSSASEEGGEYFAWRTRFWDAGYSKQLGEFTVLAQGMTGDTTITPFAGFNSTTDFDSAYALLGWERDEWRVAGRVEYFETTQHNPGTTLPFGEYGQAFTGAVSWLPNDWLRLTGEVLYVESKRNERTIVDRNPTQNETQAQLSARFYLN